MVSVVIACYNVEKYVEEAVRSVMNQTLRDIEIICVDDCSADGTLAILERLAVMDSRIKVIKHEINQGLMAVRFHGLQAATGEYTAFLDGDDFLDKLVHKGIHNIVATDYCDKRKRRCCPIWDNLIRDG